MAAAITNIVSTGYSPLLFPSSSFHPPRSHFTKPGFSKPSSFKPYSFKPLPSNSLSISSSTLKIQTLSIRSSPPFASKLHCVSKSQSPGETVIPASPGPIVRMLRTGFVGAVTAAAVFFFARFSHQPRALVKPFWSTVENADKSDVVESVLTKWGEKKSEVIDTILTKWSEKNYAEMDEILEEMRRIQPQEYDWKCFKGWVLGLHYKDYLSAKLLFLDMVMTSPLRCDGYRGLLTFAFESEELPLIKNKIDLSFKLAKDKDDLREFKSLYAEYHIKAEEYEEALRLLDELILEDPNDYAPYMFKGNLLVSRLNRKEEGDECFEKSLSCVRKNINYSDTRAQRLANSIAQVRTNAHQSSERS